MRTEATSPDVTRHRLLEGILLRLARRTPPHILAADDLSADRQWAGEFVLRGGMLLRHWFRPALRPAGDLDLVATFPFDVGEAARRFLPVLSDETVADGVAFDTERVRVEGIWLGTATPGVRVFASGVAGGTEIDFHVDIALGSSLWQAPVFGEIPTACGAAAWMWVCRPETIVGQKVQALRHLGMLGWRPKDLNDLRLLLARVSMDDTELRGVMAAYLTDVFGSGDASRSLFGPSSWWGMKVSSARWRDYFKASRGQDVPRDLAGVVAEVASRLATVLEGSR